MAEVNYCKSCKNYTATDIPFAGGGRCSVFRCAVDAWDYNDYDSGHDGDNYCSELVVRVEPETGKGEL